MPANKFSFKRPPLPGRRDFLKNSLLAGGAAMASASGLAQDSRFASRSDVVDTRQGKVQGLRFAGGVQAFYGIPYGQPTSADKRFMKPAPAASWSGVHDASLIGSRCPQAPSGPNGPTVEVFSLDRKETMGEDCLSINVFTPATDNKTRPVMVWLHGGGYSSGSASWLLYEGGNLADSEDVVVVTVNHRLNAFGFLYLEELGGEAYADSGNAGMLDIIAVLEWVRDNIENFGGNPDNVTIFGQSGGAGKVSTLLAMPGASGLFHKAIAMSGSALTSISKDAATATAERALAALEISPNKLAALQQLSWQQLLNISLSTPGMNLGPVVDGRHLPADPFSPGAPALSKDIPLLMGSTEHEVNFFPTTPLEEISGNDLMNRISPMVGNDVEKALGIIGMYRANRPNVSNVELYQIMASDSSFRRGVITQAERKADQQGAPVYMYYFTWQSPVRDGLLRAYHCLDIPFAFNNVDVCAAMVGAGQNRYALASRMSGSFASFARTGKPGHEELPEWTAFDSDSRAMMIFNDEPELINDPYGRERQALYM